MSAVPTYVGLGSNLNNPRRQILQALSSLEALPSCKFIRSSSLYRSPPMGPKDQPMYVNAVALIETLWQPLELLENLQDIERRQGRERLGEHWGPRTLDLDLLLYGEQTIHTKELVVPHPGLHQRAFVLYPLKELTPELQIPDLGLLQDLVAACPRGGLEKLEEDL